MPTYEYECQSCHERVEAVQTFVDPSLTVCPRCGGELRKVFSAVGIVFKGSGFYKNDSRAKSKSSRAGADGDAKSPTAPGETTTPKSDTKEKSAPVPAPAASVSSPSSAASTPAPASKTSD